MLESKVNQEDNHSEDQRGNQDEKGRVLQLLPGGPGDLLGQLQIGLFQIVNNLTHLCLQWAGGKIGSGNPLAFSLNIYQIVTFDIGRGSRIRTHIDGFGDR